MRILFVGDSMTLGGAGEFTWRYRMWQHLERTCTEPYRIVGPLDTVHEDSHGYADPAFPPAARRHLARWGHGWHHMAPVVGDAVRDSGADTLLVSLGLIDLGFYTNAEQTATNTRRFIAAARAARPGVRLVLLPVLPNVRAANDPPFAAECGRFNALLATAVADLATPASPLLLAAAPADWDVARDTHDGTHPSPEGEHRLAAAFAGALHQAWAVGGPYLARSAPRGAPVLA